MAEADRRAVERVAVTSDTTCSFVSPLVEDFGAARVRDISLNGIGVILGRKIEVGTLLVMELVNESRGFSRTMILRVAHVTQVNGGYLVGGEFATPLNYQEFTSLVMKA
jgi:hypothetical protein